MTVTEKQTRTFVVEDVVGSLLFSGTEISSLGLMTLQQPEVYAWDGVLLSDRIDGALNDLGVPRLVQFDPITGDEVTYKVKVTVEVEKSAVGH